MRKRRKSEKSCQKILHRASNLAWASKFNLARRWSVNFDARKFSNFNFIAPHRVQNNKNKLARTTFIWKQLAILAYNTGAALLWYIVPQQQQNKYDRTEIKSSARRKKVRGWYWNSEYYITILLFFSFVQSILYWETVYLILTVRNQLCFLLLSIFIVVGSPKRKYGRSGEDVYLFNNNN